MNTSGLSCKRGWSREFDLMSSSSQSSPTLTVRNCDEQITIIK